MLNEFAVQKMGWQRLQEGLQAAEQQRLVREAEGRRRPSPGMSVKRLRSEGAAGPDGGGRIPPDAPRAGEMPSL